MGYTARKIAGLLLPGVPYGFGSVQNIAGSGAIDLGGLPEGHARGLDEIVQTLTRRFRRALGMLLVDISERKRLEAANAQLAAIVEASEDAIISKGLSGIIQTWNASAERVYGYSAEEAIGQSMSFLLPPSRAEEEEQILDKIRRGERVEHFETVRVRMMPHSA